MDRKTHPKPTNSWHRRVKPSKPAVRSEASPYQPSYILSPSSKEAHAWGLTPSMADSANPTQYSRYNLRILLNTVFLEKSHQKAMDGMCKQRHCHPSRLPCRSVDDLSAPDVEAQGTRHTRASGARIGYHVQQGERNDLGNFAQDSCEPKSQRPIPLTEKVEEKDTFPTGTASQARSLWCPGCACLSPGSALCP